MTILFEDVRERLAYLRRRGRIGQIDFSEVLYADDTLVVTRDTRAAQDMLQAITEDSSCYNMRLNCDKCKTIFMNKRNRVKFPSGEVVENVSQQVHRASANSSKKNPGTG